MEKIKMAANKMIMINSADFKLDAMTSSNSDIYFKGFAI